MNTLTAEAAQIIEEALVSQWMPGNDAQEQVTTPDVCGEVCARAKLCYGCGKALDESNVKLAEQAVQEPVGMKDAIIAGNEILLNEQAWLLRECRGMLDALIEKFPKHAGLLCGSTTIGNLRAELGKYRPSGVMNGASN